MRVGVPKSLLYYRLFPLWRFFLEALGLEVVTSDGALWGILEKGIPFFEDSCLPLKLLIPHAQSLVGKVDAIFLPRVISLGGKTILCPKFRGAPDVLRLALGGGCEIWDGVIDMRLGRRGMEEFWRLLAKATGKRFTSVRKAYERAQDHFQFFRAELADRINTLPIEEVFAPAFVPQGKKMERRYKVAFIGRSYNLLDPFLNKGLLTLAKEMEVEIVTSQAVPEKMWQRRVRDLPKEIYWETAREIVGGILTIAEEGLAEGIVFVTSFKCGIDALMQEFLKREVGQARRGGVPFMTLTFDEHTTVEGTRTRLEAFLDLIEQRRGDVP